MRSAVRRGGRCGFLGEEPGKLLARQREQLRGLLHSVGSELVRGIAQEGFRQAGPVHRQQAQDKLAVPVPRFYVVRRESVNRDLEAGVVGGDELVGVGGLAKREQESQQRVGRRYRAVGGQIVIEGEHRAAQLCEQRFERVQQHVVDGVALKIVLGQQCVVPLCPEAVPVTPLALPHV